MPPELQHASIAALYKNKGTRAACGNYRGISLLSIAGMILARVMLNRLLSSVAEKNQHHRAESPPLHLLQYAVRDLDLGVYIKYRLDGSFVDLHHLATKTKTFERLILEALFADACALMAHEENNMQIIVDRFSSASKLFALTISLSKTEVQFQPAPEKTADQPFITTDGTQLSNVTTFKYLGSTISNDGSLDHEINARIQKASHAFERLRSKFLQRNVPETCETTGAIRSLRSIMMIRWYDRITNQKALDRANVTRIETTVLKKGRTKRRFKDQLKANLKWASLKPKELEPVASDRSSWHAATQTEANAYKDDRRHRLEVTRGNTKEKVTHRNSEWQCVINYFQYLAISI
ncbi:uncharacterized protein LOC143019834 [Oratosquilla oratoria]|uniref:uncharacterized protein LOC143019834 n=1 Tax=Oratosquilla oratoria TaxID=337810 RepID=UPI003F75A0BD